MSHQEQSVNKQILSLALPTLGFIVISPLLLAIDTAFVGRLGTIPLASLSIATIILNTSFSIFIFLSYGTASKVGKNFGSGNISQAYYYGLQSIWLALLIGIFTCCFLYFYSYQILLFLGVSNQVALLAQTYILVSLPGLFAIIISLACVGLLRGMLDSVTPLIFSAIGAIINVILTAIFILLFNWGLTGAGIATSISEIIILIGLLTVIVNKAKNYKINFWPSKFIFTTLFQNIPLLIRSLTLNASFIAVGIVVSSLGTVNIASHQIIYTINVCIILLLDSFAIASQSLIAVEMGKQNREQLIILTKKCFNFNTIMAVILGIALCIFAPYLPLIFTADTVLHSNVVFPIILIGIFLPAISFAFIGDGVLIGAGDTIYLAVAGVINFLIYSIVLSIIYSYFSNTHGLLALWVCMLSIFYGGRAIANTYRLFSYKWIDF